MPIHAYTLPDWPNYQVNAQVGAHKLTMDEPPADGGLNQGPNPFETVVMGLASCTLITLRMYLENKQLPLPALHVNLDFSTDARGLKLTEIKREVILEGTQDLLDQYPLDRILNVVNKCPVHNLLAPVVSIDTTVVTKALA